MCTRNLCALHNFDMWQDMQTMELCVTMGVLIDHVYSHREAHVISRSISVEYANFRGWVHIMDMIHSFFIARGRWHNATTFMVLRWLNLTARLRYSMHSLLTFILLINTHYMWLCACAGHSIPKNSAHYSKYMFNASKYLLFQKLCQHIWCRPNYSNTKNLTTCFYSEL